MYYSRAASVVYISVAHNTFWLLCHIYLDAAVSPLASAALTGVEGWEEWVKRPPDCSIGILKQAGFPYSFVCLTNHVGQIKAAGHTCLCMPLECSPHSHTRHMLHCDSLQFV